MGRDRRLSNGCLPLTRDPQEGVLETCSITGREQLLWVRRGAARTAEFLRQRKWLVEDAIGRPNAALPPTRRRCGVENLHRVILPDADDRLSPAAFGSDHDGSPLPRVRSCRDV